MKKNLKKSELELLQEESAGAVSTIRTLIQSLRSVNERAAEVKAANNEKIEAIKAENSVLDKMISGNLKVADNFEKLLG